MRRLLLVRLAALPPRRLRRRSRGHPDRARPRPGPRPRRAHADPRARRPAHRRRLHRGRHLAAGRRPRGGDPQRRHPHRGERGDRPLHPDQGRQGPQRARNRPSSPSTRARPWWSTAYQCTDYPCYTADGGGGDRDPGHLGGTARGSADRRPADAFTCTRGCPGHGQWDVPITVGSPELLANEQVDIFASCANAAGHDHRRGLAAAALAPGGGLAEPRHPGHRQRAAGLLPGRRNHLELSHRAGWRRLRRLSRPGYRGCGRRVRCGRVPRSRPMPQVSRSLIRCKGQRSGVGAATHRPTRGGTRPDGPGGTRQEGSVGQRDTGEFICGCLVVLEEWSWA